MQYYHCFYEYLDYLRGESEEFEDLKTVAILDNAIEEFISTEGNPFSFFTMYY